MSLTTLFYPKSIAVIGASRKPHTVGNDVVKNLITQGYKGRIHLVNPKADSLFGLKVHHSIEEIDDQIDSIVVCVPAPFVASSVESAAKKGVKAAIVISAGCKEIGNVDLENQLKEVCHKHDITLVGPNCLGVINAEIRMNASFASVLPDAGNVAFVSQSGALCTAVLDYAKEMGLGFSKFMSIGNKADVDELKLIKYFADDPKTKVIAMYVEQLQDAPGIIEAVKNITRGDNPKPVILLKSGRTEEGASAVASHTGSLSGGDIAYDSLFKQSGIIRANSISQLFDYAQIFSKNDLQKVDNVAIITNAGGPGVLTTDEIISNNLKLAQLTEETKSSLKSFLPIAASVNNPIDVLGDAQSDRYFKTLELVQADPNVDAMIVLLTPQSMTEIEETANAIVEVNKQSPKPLIVSFMGQKTVRPGVKRLQQAGLTTTTFPEPAAKGLSIFSQFHTWSKQPKGTHFTYKDVDKQKVAEIFKKAKAEGKTQFPEAEALEILRAYNFPLLQSKQASTKAEALKITKHIGGRCAMKIVSQDILHKSDVGGVILNITDKNIEEKYDEMMTTVKKNKPEAKLDGVLLMEMAPEGGVETILGVNKSPGLGTMIMFGLGGIYVEILKDVSFGFAPITREAASRMIESLKTSEIFNGVRGQKPMDKEATIEALGRLSQLVTDFPEIVELDINPLLMLPTGQGVKSLDARIVIG